MSYKNIRNYATQFEELIKFPVEITFGEKKTPSRHPWNWSKLTESIICNEEAMNFAVLTGEVSNIIVIDLDVKTNQNSIEWFEKVFGNVKEIDTLCTGSPSGGFHVYFKYTEEISKKIVSKSPDIDILTNGSCCYQGDKYEIVKDTGIRELTSSEIQEILLLGKKAEKESDVVPKEVYAYEKVEYILEHLETSRWDNREDWIRLGYFLHTIENGKKLFDKFSKKSNKFDNESHNDQWDSLKPKKDIKQVTIKTILNWLREDNYTEWKKTIYESEYNKQVSSDSGTQAVNVCKVHKNFIETNNVIYGDLLESHNKSNPDCSGPKVGSKIFMNKEMVSANDNEIPIYCRNCSFVHSFKGACITKELTPTIYNLIVNNKTEDINNKDTLQIADRIREKVDLLYVQKEWYLFNTVSGIYERKEDFEIDALMVSEMKDEEEGEWLNKIGYRSNLTRDLEKRCSSKVELDKNPDLLGFKNGVYDLSKDLFRIGKKEEYISMVCGVEYKPGTDTKLAESVIESIFPNAVERQYSIYRLSLCLDAHNREQAITFNYGYTASNGKSFLMERMCNVLGDYSDSFTSNLLTSKMRSVGEANVSLINFKNKRFMYCSEPESGSKLNTNFIKLLTGDVIKARGLYSNKEESIQPSFKIFVCCNELPSFDSYDEGIARRIRMLEYKTKFTLKPKRKNEKLLKKYSMREQQEIEAGLLVLLLKNYKKLKEQDFILEEPDSIIGICKLYLNDNKGKISELLMEKYTIGNNNDSVSLQDIKLFLKNSGIVEKDAVTLRYMVLDLFPDTEFKVDTPNVNGRRIKNSFVGLKQNDK
jgi:P4 family phage/plasmid primase-like protien